MSNGQHRNEGRPPGPHEWSPNFLEQAVLKGIDEQFITHAEKFGEYISQDENQNKKVSKSQIRDVFSTVRLLEMRASGEPPTEEMIEELRMVRPRLSYAAKRHGGKVRDLENVLKPAIIAVTGPNVDEKERRKRFRRFCQGFEAILAYHKD